jgi:hypothetical protein
MKKSTAIKINSKKGFFGKFWNEFRKCKELKL